MVTVAVHLIAWSVTFGLYAAGVIGLFYLGASPMIVGWLIILVRQGRIETGPTETGPTPKPPPPGADFAFNGLAGSDLVVFNALKTQPLPGPVPVSKLEFLTGYARSTVIEATYRLTEYGMVDRERDRPGLPYTYAIKDNYALPHS